MSGLEVNQNCEYTHASFRLVGDRLDTAVVETRTGLTGDFGSEKDQLRRSATGRGVRQPTGVWFMSTEDRVGSTNVERHILCLLEILEPVKRQLLDVVHEQSLSADFYCYWSPPADKAGLSLVRRPWVASAN